MINIYFPNVLLDVVVVRVARSARASSHSHHSAAPPSHHDAFVRQPPIDKSVRACLCVQACICVCTHDERRSILRASMCFCLDAFGTFLGASAPHHQDTHTSTHTHSKRETSAYITRIHTHLCVHANDVLCCCSSNLRRLRARAVPTPCISSRPT